MLRFQVPHHQELREREEAQLHPVSVDRPSRAPLDTVGELFEIGFRAEALVIEDFRQLESEIRAQPFLEGQVGDDLGIAGAQVEGGASVIPDEFDGHQDQGRLAHHIGAFALVPAQEPHREVEDIDALLLLRGSCVCEKAQETALQSLWAEPGLQQQVPIPGFTIFRVFCIIGQR